MVNLKKHPLSKFKVRATLYKDAITYKFDNRRVTLHMEEKEQGYLMEFRRMLENKDRGKVKDLVGYTVGQHIVKDKICITQIGLTMESMAAIVQQYCELNGLELIYKRK